MKKARKALLTLCAALLLVSMTVGVTVAYLTSTTEVVTNTFTVGNVAITLDEAKVNEYGVKVTPEERVKANTYKLIPGHTYTKDPTITVGAASEDCWVRAKVTINNNALLDEIFAPGVQLDTILTGTSAYWEYKGYTVVDNTRVYELWYKTVVKASDKLDPVFTQLVVPGSVTSENIKKLENAGLKISVVADAIQADGFTTAAAAWAAWQN